MVVRPQRGSPAGRHRLQLVGGGPPAPPVAVPAVPFQPRVGREGHVGGSQAREAVAERLGIRQVDLALRDRGLGQMQVRIGQPGDRDLIGFEVRSAG